MFSAFVLLLVGTVMVAGTLRGLRRGRMMTLTRSADQAHERWARRGEGGFWLYAVVWLAGGGYILYHGVRLLHGL